MDTFTTLWNRIMLRVPAAGPDLCQDVIRDMFNQLMERREWSWLMQTSSFYVPNYKPPQGSTVDVTGGSAVFFGTGTNFTQDMKDKQIRVGTVGGSSYPTYTILQVVSPTMIVIDRPWVGPTLAAQPYMVFQCYFTVPEDFQYFYSVTSPTANYRLNHNATQAEFDSYDPQRSQSGISYALAFYDFTKNLQGFIAPTLQVHGVGQIPVSTSAVGYSYPEDSIYSIEIVNGGSPGTVTFNWKQQNGITSGTGLTGNVTPTDLSNGVQVYFPAGTYVAGDIFVISCTTEALTGLPRYELWPRPIDASYVYPYLYARKLPALSDELPQLPEFIAKRGDVLLEMGLTQLALWPGTPNQPNLYHDLGTSNQHRAWAEKLIYELETKDDSTAIKDLIYTNLPFMGPWRDGSWLQQHAMYPEAY